MHFGQLRFKDTGWALNGIDRYTAVLLLSLATKQFDTRYFLRFQFIWMIEKILGNESSYSFIPINAACAEGEFTKMPTKIP